MEEGEVDDGEEVPTPVEMEEKTREKGGICKFYARGQCTWGPECKFQHTGTSKGDFLSVIGKERRLETVQYSGNYQMFPDARPIASLIPPGGLAKVKMPPRYPARDKVDPPEIPPLIPPLIPRVSAPTDDTESAWERGLKQAKEVRMVEINFFTITICYSLVPTMWQQTSPIWCHHLCGIFLAASQFTGDLFIPKNSLSYCIAIASIEISQI